LISLPLSGSYSKGHKVNGGPNGQRGRPENPKEVREMTATTNINRAPRNLITLLLSIVVATVAMYAASAALTAKPAEAATCAAGSIRPYWIEARERIEATGKITCTGTNNVVRQMTVTTELLRQNANGGWSRIGNAVTVTRYNVAGVSAVALKNCAYPYPDGVYRTKTSGYTVAQNGYRKTYTPVYSGTTWISC
jgi:hypothetical protein